MQRCARLWDYPGLEAQVARDLGIPVISYRDAVWPDFERPPLDMPLFWDHQRHPSPLSSGLYSDMVKFALMSLLLPGDTRTLEPGKCPGIPLDAAAFSARWALGTSAPSCAMRNPNAGAQTMLPLPSEVIGPWELRADVKDRAVGWVVQYDATSGVSMAITFPVVFSSNPRLEVTVLRSYENFLDASLSFNDPECAAGSFHAGDDHMRLRGSWEQRFSLPDTTVWDPSGLASAFAKAEDSVRELPCTTTPGKTYNLTITLASAGGAASALTVYIVAMAV